MKYKVVSIGYHKDGITSNIWHKGEFYDLEDALEVCSKWKKERQSKAETGYAECLIPMWECRCGWLLEDEYMVCENCGCQKTDPDAMNQREGELGATDMEKCDVCGEYWSNTPKSLRIQRHRDGRMVCINCALKEAEAGE